MNPLPEPPPPPLSVSPQYAHAAPWIRDHLAHGAPMLRWLPTPPRERTRPGFDYDDERVQLLDVRTVAAPAPYVGDPFLYVWRVAVDQAGGHVAGPARIEYLNPDPRYLGAPL